MADDRMKKDDLRNMGTGQGQDEEYGQGQQGKGQQSPGRNPQGGQQGGQQGGERRPMTDEDEAEFGGGTTGQRGQNRGGQNR